MSRLCEASTRPLSNKSGKTLSGLFAEFDTKNQNDRIYPRKIYEAALEELLPKIREGRLLGECDHPDYDEVRLANVSHVVKECSIKNNKLYGSVELLDTPSGKLVQSLVEAGIPIGISSRGVGNTRRISEGTEVTDLKLITFDLVADPSFSEAVLSESAKVTLKNRLDSIERTLPLNEAAGENTSIRSRINKIRENIDKAPSITDNLIESIGNLTIEGTKLQEKLSESSKRNKSLRSNMSKIQEHCNELDAEVYALKTKLLECAKGYKDKLSKTKSSYEEKSSKLKESYEATILELRKELAIEKRGLSKDNMMPILEGLSTQDEIDSKLDSLKSLNARRFPTIPVESLTEAVQTDKKPSKLSSIVSRV